MTLTTDRTRVEYAHIGNTTWGYTAGLRDFLFDLVEQPGCDVLELDVHDVTTIDRNGVALLIGLNLRANAIGHTLVLIDAHGPVSTELDRLGLTDDFTVNVEPSASARRRPRG